MHDKTNTTNEKCNFQAMYNDLEDKDLKLVV